MDECASGKQPQAFAQMMLLKRDENCSQAYLLCPNERLSDMLSVCVCVSIVKAHMGIRATDNGTEEVNACSLEIVQFAA